MPDTDNEYDKAALRRLRKEKKQEEKEIKEAVRVLLRKDRERRLAKKELAEQQ